MRTIEELTQLIAELPSIGPRQARRIVQYLLKKNGSFRKELSEKILELSNHVFQCPSCFRYAEGTGKGLCSLCKDSSRDQKTLMVVEKDVDIDGIEAANTYRGRYFVLGGLLPFGRQRKKTDTVRIKELLFRIQKNPSTTLGSIRDTSLMTDGVTEIIFALATTPEGDYTASELTKEIKAKVPGISVTLLGRGLSVGAEIEYADQETIRNALKNRS